MTAAHRRARRALEHALGALAAGLPAVAIAFVQVALQALVEEPPRVTAAPPRPTASGGVSMRIGLVAPRPDPAALTRDELAELLGDEEPAR